jgi:hypothetical protein
VELILVFDAVVPPPVFSQGEEGTSWYIILKGSVNVVIYGKVGDSFPSVSDSDSD